MVKFRIGSKLMVATLLLVAAIWIASDSIVSAFVGLLQSTPPEDQTIKTKRIQSNPDSVDTMLLLWEEAMQEATLMLSSSDCVLQTNNLPSCVLPDTERTKALVAKLQR